MATAIRTRIRKPPMPMSVAAMGVHRFSVDQYHRMIETGVLGEDDRVELIDGFIVPKMPQNPPHSVALTRLHTKLIRMIESGWFIRPQCPITLSESEPEPDLCLARIDCPDERHPHAKESGLVVEVADSSLASDRTDKLQIYARDKVPVYWIVNLPERTIEVYEVPNGTRAKPRYKTKRIYAETESVPVVLDGVKVGEIAVGEILPKAS